MQRYDISSVLDLTNEQTEPPGKPEKYLMRGKKVARLDPKKVVGICVHQTACVFGVDNAQIKAAGGNRILAKHRRALNVAANVTAFNTGRAVYANPLGWYVYHGNGFNPFTYSLEIEGLFYGIEGDEETLAGDRKYLSRMNDLLIDAARTAITFLVERGREKGSPIEWVYAHRQSSPTRRSDPGQMPWKTVVLDYAVPVLGLKVNNDLVLNTKKGSGYPIPVDWDPTAKARY